MTTNISSMESLQVFDINNDGKKDVLTAGGFSADAVVNLGNLAFQRKDLSYPFKPIRCSVGGDYNGDGKPDYAVGTNSSAQLNSEFVDLSHLKSGIYVLSMTDIETQQVKAATIIKD